MMMTMIVTTIITLHYHHHHLHHHRHHYRHHHHHHPHHRYHHRGTASKRQMENNLKYAQRAIDFHSLKTEHVDAIDGLTINHGQCI